MTETRKCSRCKEFKDLKEFYRTSRGGYRCYCKPCEKVRNKRFKVNCFRCGIEFMCVRNHGYCSRQCKDEGLSIRMKLEYSHELRKPTGERNYERRM